MAGSEGTWNRATTLEQLGGDETLLEEILDIFLSEAPKHLDSLRIAVAEGTAETVEKAAHTLKGELGYLGVPEISRKAAEMEGKGRSGNLTGAASLLKQFEEELNGLLRNVRSAVAK